MAFIREMHGFQSPALVIEKMNYFSQAKKNAADSIPFYDKYVLLAGDSRRLAVSKTFMEDLTLDAMAYFEK